MALVQKRPPQASSWTKPVCRDLIPLFEQPVMLIHDSVQFSATILWWLRLVNDVEIHGTFYYHLVVRFILAHDFSDLRRQQVCCSEITAKARSG